MARFIVIAVCIVFTATAVTGWVSSKVFASVVYVFFIIEFLAGISLTFFTDRNEAFNDRLILWHSKIGIFYDKYKKALLLDKKNTIAAFGKVTLADTVFILLITTEPVLKEYGAGSWGYSMVSMQILASFVAIAVHIVVYLRIGDIIKEKAEK